MNKSNEEYIEEFHVAFGVSVGEEPTAELLKLRRALVEEEVKEFFEELDMAIEKLEGERKLIKKTILIYSRKWLMCKWCFQGQPFR